MINEFLTDNHTNGEGIIDINEHPVMMALTASIIKDDRETDFDCMVFELMESDEIKDYCETMILQKLGNIVTDNMAVDKAAFNILTETIDRLLRAG